MLIIYTVVYFNDSNKFIIFFIVTDEEVHSKIVIDNDNTSKKVSTDSPAPEICEYLESKGDYYFDNNCESFTVILACSCAVY